MRYANAYDTRNESQKLLDGPFLFRPYRGAKSPAVRGFSISFYVSNMVTCLTHGNRFTRRYNVNMSHSNNPKTPPKHTYEPLTPPNSTRYPGGIVL